jgi:hypothetical protein
MVQRNLSFVMASRASGTSGQQREQASGCGEDDKYPFHNFQGFSNGFQTPKRKI